MNDKTLYTELKKIEEKKAISDKSFKSEERRIKSIYNSDYTKQFEETIASIETNYNMGLITIHEKLNQQIEEMQQAKKALFPYEETHY